MAASGGKTGLVFLPVSAASGGFPSGLEFSIDGVGGIRASGGFVDIGVFSPRSDDWTVPSDSDNLTGARLANVPDGLGDEEEVPFEIVRDLGGSRRAEKAEGLENWAEINWLGRHEEPGGRGGRRGRGWERRSPRLGRRGEAGQEVRGGLGSTGKRGIGRS